MRYCSLHTHSVFSDGKHTLEENVISAIEKGICVLGFSDHSFTPCDTSYCMKTEDYPAYLAEIARLKEKYKDKIELLAGIELDYDSDPDTSLFDYRIASVHYIIRDGVVYPIDHSKVQQEQCVAEAFDGDVEKMAKCYFQQLTDHVKRCKPTFVGHFDVITKFGLMPEDSPTYRQIAADALKEILQVCPYVEMNTGAISRGYRQTPYPAAYLLEAIKQQGGKILLSSDSHQKENLDFWFDEAVALLRQAGFECIQVLHSTGFEEVPI